MALTFRRASILIFAAACLLDTGEGKSTGPFPGFFGIQACMNSRGVKDDASAFLLFCTRLSSVAECYNKIIADMPHILSDYFNIVFNMSKIVSGYTKMCSKLKEYVEINGLKQLLKLESNKNRKLSYGAVFRDATAMSQNNNRTTEFEIAACKSAMVWTNTSEWQLTDDNMQTLRGIMNATNWEVLSDTCHAHLTSGTSRSTVSPSVLGISLSKLAMCLNGTLPQWTYVYDERIKCDKDNVTHWRHMACERADEMLGCISRYFARVTFSPNSELHIAKFLFDLDSQKKAFVTYCKSPRALRNQLQCLPARVTNRAVRTCFTPWIAQLTSIFGDQKKTGIENEVCRKTVARITCEKDVLSPTAPRAVELYAKLEMDGLPPFCKNRMTTKIAKNNDLTSSKSRDGTTVSSPANTPPQSVAAYSIVLMITVYLYQ